MALHAQALGLILAADTIDPNTFHLDWERTFEALAAVVVLSIIMERALSLFYESHWWLARKALRDSREMVAFAACTAICWFLQFDALSIIILQDKPYMIGYLITGAVIAGGSKGSIKLFRDVLDFKSQAYKEYEESKPANKGADPEETLSKARAAQFKAAEVHDMAAQAEADARAASAQTVQPEVKAAADKAAATAAGVKSTAAEAVALTAMAVMAATSAAAKAKAKGKATGVNP